MASNRWAGVASAQFLLLRINPDCSIRPGALARLVDAIGVDDPVGMARGLAYSFGLNRQVIGGRAVFNAYRSIVRACRLVGFGDRWPRLFFDFHLHKQTLPDYAIEVEAISGL